MVFTRNSDIVDQNSWLPIKLKWTNISDNISWRALLSTKSGDLYFDITRVGTAPDTLDPSWQIYQPLRPNSNMKVNNAALQVSRAGYIPFAVSLLSEFTPDDFAKMQKQKFQKIRRLQMPPHVMTNLLKGCVDEKDC
jgi:hypothetical protein